MSDLHGFDVSHYQGRMDFHESRRQLGFAVCKATQGTDDVDEDYAHDIGELRELGDLRGSYHYPNPGDPIAQAQFYVEHADRHNGEMQALDFEGLILNTLDPVGWAAAWLAHVLELTRNLPLIYMSGSTVTRFNWARVIELGTGLWVASWDEKPDPGAWPFVIMWQRSDSGELRGADGDVDQDVFFGDAESWEHYADNRTADPEPPPRPKPSPGPGTGEHHHDGDGEKTYEVREGDTLDTIANHLGVHPDHLVRLNEHKHPSLTWNRNLLRVGWHLIVP